MNDDIITSGLESDRYLKARQLAHDFETTLIDTLETTGREMLRSAEYDTDVTFHDQAFGPEYTATLATIRTEAPLRHDAAPDANTKLNVGIDGSHRTRSTTHQPTMTHTRTSSTNSSTAPKPCTTPSATQRLAATRGPTFDSTMTSGTARKTRPGIVAIPLTGSEALDECLTTLQHHFTDVYAPVHKR